VTPVTSRSVTRARPDAEPARRRPGAIRTGWQLFTSTLSKAWQDRILGLSAEAGFWQLLSLPPLVIALLGSVGYVGSFFGPGTIDGVVEELVLLSGQVVAPDVVDEIVRPTLEQVLNEGRADVASLGFLISLWAGSTAMATYVNTITIAYDMREKRSAVRSRLLALGVYVVAVAIGVVLLPVSVIGPGLLQQLAPVEARGLIRTSIQVGYWPVVVGLLLLGLTSLYHVSLPVRLPWRRGVPGAVLAGVVFLLGTYGLRFYISHVVRGALTYGTLAAPIAALLFFFVLALAVLLGAELNAAIERRWPSTPGAEGQSERREA